MKRLAVLLSTFAFSLTGCIDESQEPPSNPGSRTPTPADTVQELSGEEIAARLLRSVVMIEMEDSQRQPMSLGTGFVVAPNVVATNYHVIRGASRGSVRPLGRDEVTLIEGTRSVDVRRDLVLLDAQTTAPPVELETAMPALGQEIFAIGNPQGLEGTLSEGIISGQREFGTDSVLQITAPISPGSSGGPVVNRRGKVLGVATASLRDGQNLNFAIPATYVAQMLDSVGSSQPLTRQAAQREASIFDEVGEEPTTGVEGTNFLWDSPIFVDVPFPSHGAYTLSLRSSIDRPVRNITYAVIFKDSEGRPLEVQFRRERRTIAPNLAIRLSGKVDESVQSLTTANGSRQPRRGRVEVRILAFDYADE